MAVALPALADGGEPPDGGSPEAPRRFTGVVGHITDARTGEDLIEATVKVVNGVKKSALTDVDGRFRLRLPPGTHELRVFYELYRSQHLGNVVVTRDQSTTLDVALEPDQRAVQEVVVEARPDKRNETALLAECKRAAVVQDSLGAQAIARTPDANAGDAVKRVVGATLVDNRYVFIRGLGGRYTQTLLNGALMPSPEPDEPSVPLDLFPVALLSNLNVIKTWSAELPANFAGGSVTIETNTFPSTLEAKVRLQAGFDTMTTGLKRPVEPLFGAENLGFNTGARALPEAIPVDRPLVPERPGTPGVTPDQQRAAAGAFAQRWTPPQAPGLPSFSFAGSVGNTHRPGRDVKLGYLFAAQLARREKRQLFQSAAVRLESTGEVPVEPYETEVGTSSGSTSLMGNLGASFGPHHELSALSVLLWNAESTATVNAGIDFAQQQPATGARSHFVSRELFLNQLKGFHRFGAVELKWAGNYARVNRLEPDLRDVRYFLDESGRKTVSFQPYSLERFFYGLHEDSGGGTASLALPWQAWRFEVGALGQYAAREFDGRRFRYLDSSRGQVSELPVETLLSGSWFGPPLSSETPISLRESTLSYDRYTSSLAVYGGFAQADWRPTTWLRAQAGVRLEGSRQVVGGGTPFSTGGAPLGDPVVKDYLDVVPAANVIISPREDLNLRLAYAYTLARPSFRELAPFLFYDMQRRRNVSGNPELINTRIHNIDARGEWFLSSSEVLALSFFAKQFDHPIERVIYGISNAVGDVSFANALGATLLGAELEARTNLKRLHPALASLEVGANFSLIYSQVQLDPASPQTNDRRPLQGQSPYAGNAFITWAHPTWGTEAGVFYNVYGPRISDVGINGLPDVIEQPFHRLDLTVAQRLGAGFQLKLAASNVLNQSVRLRQGGVDVLTNPPGVQFFATVSWNFNEERKK